MITSWAAKRRLLYLFGTVIFIAVIVAVPSYLLFYKAPTCFDGIKNQNEFGTDCGGPCSLLCQDNFIAPEVSWVKFDQSGAGVYNAGAYIINHNATAVVRKAKYVFKLFDRAGILITENYGELYIPARMNVLAFARGIEVGKRIPAKATFTFLEEPFWESYNGPQVELKESNKRLVNEDTYPTVYAEYRNDSVNDYKNVDVFAILYDLDGNTIGFSKTKIDSLMRGQTTGVVFTWPVPRIGKVSSIELIPVAPL